MSLIWSLIAIMIYLDDMRRAFLFILYYFSSFNRNFDKLILAFFYNKNEVNTTSTKTMLN